LLPKDNREIAKEDIQKKKVGLFRIRRGSGKDTFERETNPI